MRSALHIAHRMVATGLLIAIVSLFAVNSVLACSVDPASHHCCRRVPGKHPCDVPQSATAYPLLVAAALDHQDFTPAIEPAAFVTIPGPVVNQGGAAIAEVHEFDAGPPGPLPAVLRI